MISTISRLVPLIALVAIVTSCAGAADRGEDWVRHTGSAGFAGWTAPTGEWIDAGSVGLDPGDRKKLAATAGAGALVNGPKGRTKHLFTEAEHGDVQAHIEFMVPEGSNSGVYFMGRYEIQVLDSFGRETPAHSDCGGIYQRWDPARGQGKQGYEGRPPRVNAARAPGAWQTFDVIFRAPRFDEAGKKTADAAFVKVVHNGVTVHENEILSGPTRAAAFRDEAATGPLMFQGDHGPVAYRNIWLRPLELGRDGAEEALTGRCDALFDGKTFLLWGAAIVGSDPELSAAAAAAMAANQAVATPQLSAALAHPDPVIRLCAVQALGDSGPRNATLREQLTDLRDDPDEAVRRAVNEALKGFEK